MKEKPSNNAKPTDLEEKSHDTKNATEKELWMMLMAYLGTSNRSAKAAIYCELVNLVCHVFKDKPKQE